MAERSSKESKTLQFRVTSISEAGAGNLTVGFSQVSPVTTGAGAPLYTNSVTLNLSVDEAGVYFPGQVYDVTFTPA